MEIQSGGRVAKYKHCMYEWLGVDKAELAVMAELLLRGEQTVGELRGRAARMEPIPDVNALRPVLKSLMDKELVVELTPEGRGQVVSPALYRQPELDELRTQYRDHVATARQFDDAVPSAAPPQPSAVEALRRKSPSLRAEVERLRDQINQLLG